MVEYWPDAALSLLDSLWALDTRIGIIQRKMFDILREPVSAQEIRNMATRHKDKPLPKRVARDKDGKSFADTIAPVENKQPVVFYTTAPQPKEDNTVRYVPPGTHSARGFSMLGGRVR